MYTLFPLVKSIHLLTVFISVALFILRFYWKAAHSAMSDRRWVKIVPHIVDTFLLLSGILLVLITHQYPFTEGNGWLTEKLFAVVLYIGLGFIAFGRRQYSLPVRSGAFIAALIMVGIIVTLATQKMLLVV